MKIITKKIISIVILVFINSLFVLKYVPGGLVVKVLASLVAASFYVCFFYFFERIQSFLYQKTYLLKCFLIVFVFVSLGSLLLVSKDSLNVDRWHVIQVFWDSLFAGEYPYAAKSFDGNYPGPMPFYYILFLPFYLIGEIGLALIVLVLFLRSRLISGDFAQLQLLILSQIILYYEIVTRSTLLANSILFLLFFVWQNRKLKGCKTSFLIWSGIVLGFLVSTRAVFAIPTLIFYLSLLRMKILPVQKLLILGSVSVFSFLSLFIVIYIYYGSIFFQINPFIVQAEFLMPSQYSFLFLALSLVFALFPKSEAEIFYYSGVLLFITIFFYACYTISNTSLSLGIFEDHVDITYFFFSVPFISYFLISDNAPYQMPKGDYHKNG